MQIDRDSYNKAAHYAVGHGYQMRLGAPTTGVIHTTNNVHANTAFAGECKFLFESADVSAHFLIAKDGRIVQFLDPAGYVAWHAGGKQMNGVWTAKPAWSNPASWGIELHVSVYELPTQFQKDACAWLCRDLMHRFGMTPDLIETHRAIALPLGRKTDPEGWSNADFYRWRAALAAPVSPPPPPTKLRRFRALGTPIFQAKSCTGTIAAYLAPGDVFEIDAVYTDGSAHLKDERGFVHLDLNALEELP